SGVSLGDLIRAMPQRDVADFMRHYCCKLAFIPCGIEYATIDIHKAARQSERVNFFVIHNSELVWILFYRRLCRESSSYGFNVRMSLSIVEDSQLLIGFMRHLTTHLHILLRRK